MKVPLSWLKDYVEITLSPTDLAKRITLAGLEVKAMDVIGGSWDNVVIGQITAINPHPNADRLTLVTVNLGAGEETVVCGAPNVKVGAKISFAHVGARLIDGHTGEMATLKPAKIRGVASRGMVCSEKELGISENHEGILILPDDAPIGMPLASYMGDVIFNLEVTPNRPDCLSVIGIAREIAALTGAKLRLPELSYSETGPSIEGQIKVEILAPDLCPRYCASLTTGVKMGESPKWMQQRLSACGMRPISNIVDITNYVMLEYGQPLHAFNYNLIRGQQIIVRRANPGEKIMTLDGTERTLSGDTLVIADKERAVAVAGVMGGANSEVSETTTTILLEAASFKPASIHYTGRTLSMPSEACMRFERGISREMAMPALKRATQLIVQLGGGQAARGVADVYPGKEEPKTITVSTTEAKRILGVDYSLTQMTETLTSLGFACEPDSARSEVKATAPYWRSDIRLTVDLVEEVARIRGYDQIPMTMLAQPIPRQDPKPMVGLKHTVRDRLVGYGFQEVVTYSLTSAELLNKLTLSPAAIKKLKDIVGGGVPSFLSEPIKVANPMTAEQEYLRPNLRANLLNVLAANRRREEGGIRLFELGKVYLRAEGLPDERDTVCAVLSGPRLDKSWLTQCDGIDFFDAKGTVEALLAQMGISATFEKSSDESFQASKQAAILAGGKRLGIVGELNPVVLENFEIPGTACLELDLPTLLPLAAAQRKFTPLPRFPAIVRDIALVVGTEVAYQQILDIVKSFPLVEQVALFDVYTGKQVPPDKKSLAYRITYQSPTQTLTDEEVDKLQQRILDKLSRDVGATLRG